MPEKQNNESTKDGNNNGPEGTSPGNNTFQPITTQDELNKLIGERISRERAKYADYEVLKEAATELAYIKDAQKTDAEKTAERIAELEAAKTVAEAKVLRATIQAEHGISNEDADLFLTSTDEAALRKQAETLAALRSTKTSGPAPVIPQLGTGTDTGLTNEQRFEAFFAEALK